jgi:hypothetical protein
LKNDKRVLILNDCSRTGGKGDFVPQSITVGEDEMTDFGAVFSVPPMTRAKFIQIFKRFPKNKYTRIYDLLKANVAGNDINATESVLTRFFLRLFMAIFVPGTSIEEILSGKKARNNFGFYALHDLYIHENPKLFRVWWLSFGTDSIPESKTVSGLINMRACMYKNPKLFRMFCRHEVQYR